MSCRVLCPQLALSVAACTARVLVPPDPCPVSPRARVGVGVRGRPWARSQGEATQTERSDDRGVVSLGLALFGEI